MGNGCSRCGELEKAKRKLQCSLEVPKPQTKKSPPILRLPHWCCLCCGSPRSTALSKRSRTAGSATVLHSAAQCCTGTAGSVGVTRSSSCRRRLGRCGAARGRRQGWAVGCTASHRAVRRSRARRSNGSSRTSRSCAHSSRNWRSGYAQPQSLYTFTSSQPLRARKVKRHAQLIHHFGAQNDATDPAL
jgi:hypothetical protein